MFIMVSLDIVAANVTVGGCLGYFEKKDKRKNFETMGP